MGSGLWVLTTAVLVIGAFFSGQFSRRIFFALGVLAMLLYQIFNR